MPSASRFVPRNYLKLPTLWKFSDREVEWRLAINLNDAVHLARSREQHALAYAVGVQRAKYKNSIQDVARAIGEKRPNLNLKLQGHHLATEDDLIRWAWLVGKNRQSFRERPL